MYKRNKRTGITNHGVLFSSSESVNFQVQITEFNEIGKVTLELVEKHFQEGVSNSRLKWVMDFIGEKRIKTTDRNEKMKEIILNKLREVIEQNKKLIETHENKMKYNKRSGIIALRKEIYNNIDILRGVLDISSAKFTNVKVQK